MAFSLASFHVQSQGPVFSKMSCHSFLPNSGEIFLKGISTCMFVLKIHSFVPRKCSPISLSRVIFLLPPRTLCPFDSEPCGKPPTVRDASDLQGNNCSFGFSWLDGEPGQQANTSPGFLPSPGPRKQREGAPVFSLHGFGMYLISDLQPLIGVSSAWSPLG